MSATGQGDTWTLRDLPVLRVLGATEEREGSLQWGWEEALVAELPDLDADARNVCVALLIRTGFIEGDIDATLGNPLKRVRPRYLTERGRRAAGLWPSDDVVERFLVALEAAAASAPADEGKRLRALAAEAKSLGTGTLTGILVRVVTGQLGL